MTQTSTIDGVLSELRSDLSAMPSWEDRYAYIIGLGKGIAPYPNEFRTETFIVKGCQSTVWLHPSKANGRVHFDVDSDAIIVKGLVAVLMRLFNDRTPAEILEAPANILESLGLDQHLSPSRANGVYAMLKQIKLYAVAYQRMGDA